MSLQYLNIKKYYLLDKTITHPAIDKKYIQSLADIVLELDRENLFTINQLSKTNIWYFCLCKILFDFYMKFFEFME